MNHAFIYPYDEGRIALTTRGGNRTLGWGEHGRYRFIFRRFSH